MTYYFSNITLWGNRDDAQIPLRTESKGANICYYISYVIRDLDVERIQPIARTVIIENNKYEISSQLTHKTPSP